MNIKSIFCPHCHQLVRKIRLGVSMPPLKAAILDAIKAAGDVGVTSAELITSDVYKDRRPIGRGGIKSHVAQINDLLAATDWCVRAEGRGAHARWHLVKLNSEEKIR